MQFKGLWGFCGGKNLVLGHREGLMGEVTFDILESCLDFDKGSMGEWLKECCTLGAELSQSHGSRKS